MENGYSICLNKWALDKEIKNELGLLLIISSLCAKEGYCFASNSFFAELFKINEVSICRNLKKLEKKNYIEIEYEKRGAEVISRKIRLTKMLTDDYQNCKSTINKNVKDNNISINNKSNKNKEIYKESYGEYKRIKLTPEEYGRLVNEFGESFIKEQIDLLDEYIESNNNKNKYTNFNLVLRKSIRENWFNRKKGNDIVEWF